jgi:hypothetical protein
VLNLELWFKSMRKENNASCCDYQPIISNMLPNENNTCLSLLMLEQCISNVSAYYSLIIRPIAWSRHVYLCYQAICLGQRTSTSRCYKQLCATTTRDKTCASIFVDPIDRDVWSIILCAHVLVLWICAQGSLIFGS